MSTITLDSIRAAAEAKYGSTDIDVDGATVRLLNPLRLKREARDALMAIQKHLDIEDETADVDQEGLLGEAIGLIAATPAQATTLLAAIDGDLAVLAMVFNTYLEGTQAGEASASPS